MSLFLGYALKCQPSPSLIFLVYYIVVNFMLSKWKMDFQQKKQNKKFKYINIVFGLEMLLIYFYFFLNGQKKPRNEGISKYSIYRLMKIMSVLLHSEERKKSLSGRPRPDGRSVIKFSMTQTNRPLSLLYILRAGRTGSIS